MHETESRVLLVEDDPGKRYTIARQLRAAGFEVEEATTGADGLARARAEHDVAILDVKLPDMLGYDVCHQLKSNPETAEVKVLELSAIHIQPEDRARGLDLGADSYLVHPVEAIELVAAVRSLTRLRHAERDKRRALELFLAMLSHDLRSPLGTMFAGLDALAASPGLAPGDRAMLAALERSGDRMKRMIDQLMAFAQTMTGAIPVARRPIELEALCRTVVRDSCHGSTKTCELSSTFDGTIVGDPDRLTQVVDNLVINALRHGTGAVRVTLARDGDHAVITVHNQGRPIAEAALATLFDPFKRAGGGEGGVGLGLYIVRQLVRAHDGSVELSSNDADGTTFIVRLPVAGPA